MAQAQNKGLTVRFAEKAHIGLRKKEQQDYHGHLSINENRKFDRPGIYLFVIADGVSMGSDGALASKTAVEVVLGCFEGLVKEGNADLVEALNFSFKKAAQEVARLSEERPGMATTCAAVLLVGNTLVTAHVGDSRIYLASSTPDPAVKQIGVDHSWVEETGRGLVRSGNMTEAELRKAPKRHTITRALGMEGEIHVDINTTGIRTGDLILICSDGLWDLIHPSVLNNFLTEGLSTDTKLSTTEVQEQLETLTSNMEQAALNAGGRDNISLSVIYIVEAGSFYPIGSLPGLLEETAQDVKERTGFSPELSSNAPYAVHPNEASAISPSSPLKSSAGAGNRFVSGPNQVDASVPQNLEPVFSKAQKLFAMGHWDEALEEFLFIEKNNPLFHNLYEVMTNSLLRYIEGTMIQSQTERVLKLLNELEKAGVNRYNEELFTYCLEESSKANQNRNYIQGKEFAGFASRLRPTDHRTRNLLELSELYLKLSNDQQIPVTERLELAQKIYARDPEFGAIQDDLALIYMELGDEALQKGSEQDALNWYSLIRALRPGDTRLISLAANKQRSIEDDITRKESSQGALFGKTTQTFSNRSSKSGTENDFDRSGVTSKSNQAKSSFPIESIHNDTRPDNETANRLRERVSRAQKAWDGGRKEVGSEYIYLVEQLSSHISPNPWQPTFPRVCYDYGKWLLEQKQFSEARPYFQKAHALGMAAAQQRISEIDRLLRDQSYGGRGESPVDLPDSMPPFHFTSIHKPTVEEQKPVGVSDVVNHESLPDTKASSTSQMPNNRTPLIKRHVDVPEEGTFVGSSHAGDGVLTPNRREEGERPPNPLSAAAMAAGNSQTGIQKAVSATSREEFEKPERAVGSSGSQRTKEAAQEDNPLHGAASREVNRLQTQGLPQTLTPQAVLRSRKLSGVISMVQSFIPLLIVAVVIIVIVLVGLNLAGNFTKFSKSNENSTNAPAAALPTTTLAISGGGVSQTSVPGLKREVNTIVTAKIEGISSSEVRMFLIAPNDSPNAYKDRELIAENNGFRLPQSIIDRLDLGQKFTLIARPKDTSTRKYQSDLPADATLQTLWAKGDITINSGSTLEISLKIQPEALNFYPLEGGDQDLDLPNNGGRYFKNTRHILRGEFLRFYNDTKDNLNRFGYPISEEFELKDVGTVQFFERGWLVLSSDKKLVKIGSVGKTVLNDPSFDSALKPPQSVGTATFRVDPSFAVANDGHFGLPISPAYEMSSGNSKKRVQYFELARLETDPAVKNGPISLGLIGTEYARSKGWLR